MKKILCLLAFVCASVTACNRQPANLLIGNWKLLPGGDPVCDATMNFADSQASFVDQKGNARSMAVSYVAANQDKMPTSVYVITNAGVSNHTTYNFSDKNTVQLDAYFVCKYTRV